MCLYSLLPGIRKIMCRKVKKINEIYEFNEKLSDIQSIIKMENCSSYEITFCFIFFHGCLFLLKR